MYNVKWDTKINGILLTNDDSEINAPRPVFFEELDILGFDKFWKYPRTIEPLLWGIGRGYYLNGELVAKANGGNIFQSPELKITEEGNNLDLKAINIKNVVKKNYDALFILENETIDFIEHTYKTYKKEGYPFSVSFSGGKDSTAVLDLVTRVIPYDELVVIFSDTTLENSYTYDNVEKTIEEYKKKCNKLKFAISSPPKPAIDLFNEFGLPSRFHRWCTSVLKTAPYNKLLRDLAKNESKILVFEGVRTEESNKRANYERIAGGVKHFSVLNARPILYWNYSEVILYNYYRDLMMNKSYRYGLSRVGCSICPYSSEWSEFINSKIEKTINHDFIPFIRDYAIKRGLKNDKDIIKFISEGQWKKRAGGKGLNIKSAINFSESEDKFKAVIINPKENFLEWVKVLGNLMFKQQSSNKFCGELKIDDYDCSFEIIKNQNKEIIEISNIVGNIKLISKLKKILHKSTFCVHCGVCEAECSTGALKTQSKLQINSSLCNHCGNCVYFIRNGCLVSKSLDVGTGGGTMKKRTGGIDKYSTFGIREEWINEFFHYEDQWLDNNNLGPKQVQAMLRWLMDAELIETKTKKITILGKYLKSLYKTEPRFVWGIIWNNLYYNSPVIKWYSNEIEWDSITTKVELKEKIIISYPNLSKGTLSNPIDAMVNMFDRSPLGTDFSLGVLEKKGRIVKSIRKLGTDDINPLVIAYILYKVGEYYWRRDFTVSEFYNKEFIGGPFKLFGISRVKLEKILRGLQEDNNQLLRVDLTADLDNIYLKDDISSLDIIKIATELMK